MRNETSFSGRLRGCLTVLVLALVVGLVPLGAAFGDSPPDTTKLRRSGELSEEIRHQTYEDLTRDLHELLLQQDVMGRVRSELEDAFDGSPQMAMKVHLLDLTILQDLAAILPKVGSSIEELRLKTRTQIARDRMLGGRRQGEVAETQGRIDQIAGELLVGFHGEDDGVVADRKRGIEGSLYQLILKRDEAHADAERYTEGAAAGAKEIRALARLDERLDWLAVSWAIYAERLQAAVENESEALIAAKSSRHRQTIRESMALLETAQEAAKILVSSREQKPVHEGLPLDKTLDTVQMDLTPDQMQVVEEELRAVQARLAKGNAPEAVAVQETGVKPEK